MPLVDGSAREIGDELSGPVEGPHDPLGVDPAFEPESGIGSHAEKSRPAAYRGWIKVGALEKHRLRVLFYLGVLATHDSGNGHGLAAVADHEGLGIQVPCLAVQGDERLSLPGSADDDSPFLEEAEVKGMERLT